MNNENEDLNMQIVDVLNRTAFIDRVVRVIKHLSFAKRSAAFSIEGDWGAGKTFVLNSIIEELRKEQSEETNTNRFSLFYYNCWEYDYYEEPASAIASMLLDQLAEEEGAVRIVREHVDKARRLLVESLKWFVSARFGLDVNNLINAVGQTDSPLEEARKAVDEMDVFREGLKAVREALKKVAETHTIVLFIDELDRCLPSYTIKVLERVHHFCDDVDNMVVVYAVDGKQLQYTIQQIFGTKASCEGYLRKFIDFGFALDHGEVQNEISDLKADYFSLFEQIYSKAARDEIVGRVQLLLKKSGLGIRTLIKLFDKAKTLHKVVFGEQRTDYSVLLYEVVLVLFFDKVAGARGVLHELVLIDRGRRHTPIEEPLGTLFTALRDLKTEALKGHRVTTSSFNDKVVCENAIEYLFCFLTWVVIDELNPDSVEFVLDNTVDFGTTEEQLKRDCRLYVDMLTLMSPE